MSALLAASLFGSSLTLLLILLKSNLLKRYGGSWYFYIWLLVLFVLVMPYKINLINVFQVNSLQNDYIPLNTYIKKEVKIEDAQKDIVLNDNTFKETSNIDKDITAAKKTNNFRIESIIIWLYFIGLSVFISYYLYSYLRFQYKIINSLNVVEDECYFDILEEVKNELGIKKDIKIYGSSIIQTPIILNIFNPIVALPKKELKKSEIKMIFIHELTHYKRKDILFKLLSLIVNAIHWFNPMVYIAVNNINEACEYSCDEFVTRKMCEEKRIEYGNMLLNFVQISNNNSLFAAGLSNRNRNKKVLKRRLSIIMKDKKHSRVFITILALIIVIFSSNVFALNTIDIESPANIEGKTSVDKGHPETFKSKDIESSANNKEKLSISKNYREIFNTVGKYINSSYVDMSESQEDLTGEDINLDLLEPQEEDLTEDDIKLDLLESQEVDLTGEDIKLDLLESAEGQFIEDNINTEVAGDGDLENYETDIVNFENLDTDREEINDFKPRETFNSVMGYINPAYIDLLEPVGESCIKDDIKLEVVGAVTIGNYASVVVTLEDLDTERNAFNSYDSGFSGLKAYAETEGGENVRSRRVFESYFDEKNNKYIVEMLIDDYYPINPENMSVVLESVYYDNKEIENDWEIDFSLKDATT